MFASAQRRDAGGLSDANQLLAEAWDMANSDDDLRSAILYERGKLAGLAGDTYGAIHHYQESADRAQNTVSKLVSQTAVDWHKLYTTASLLPEIDEASRIFRDNMVIRSNDALMTSQVNKLCSDKFRPFVYHTESSLQAAKRYVYATIDFATDLAEQRNFADAIRNLAKAEYCIDTFRLTALRPIFYDNLAVTFLSHGDFWRAALSASISIDLYKRLDLKESFGYPLTTYILSLRRLRLDSAPDRARKFDQLFATVNSMAESIPIDMGNHWIVDRVRLIVDGYRKSL
jgi:hypothetical protein